MRDRGAIGGAAGLPPMPSAKSLLFSPMLRPKDVPEVFEIDGSWRDLYVLDTTVEDWKEMLRMVRDRKTIDYTLRIEDQAAAIPEPPEPVFMRSGEVGWSLSVNIDGLILNAHFFGPEIIECDIDPRELTANRFYELLDFMESLGRRLKKEVRLTPENRSEEPIVKYDPIVDRIVKVAEEERKRE